jgi:hypothetical protein
MRKDEELAFGQYRKWMRETKKRLKKDPLPIVKNELAKVISCVCSNSIM